MEQFNKCNSLEEMMVIKSQDQRGAEHLEQSTHASCTGLGPHPKTLQTEQVGGGCQEIQ